jgi:hypothetical protein
MKQVYRIDADGYYVEPVITDETPSDCIEVQPPQGLYRGKWTGSEWIEGMTQEEIDGFKNQPRPKTQLEILQETVDMLVLDNLGVL